MTTPSLRMADGAGLKGRIEMPKAKKAKMQLAS
jgi:hypothetical protein